MTLTRTSWIPRLKSRGGGSSIAIADGGSASDSVDADGDGSTGSDAGSDNGVDADAGSSVDDSVGDESADVDMSAGDYGRVDDDSVDAGIAALSDDGGVSDVAIKDWLDADEASVTELTVTDIASGTADFDDDDSPGNDSSASNNIIRSFDRATYNLRIVTTSDDSMTYYRNARIGIRINIPVSTDYAAVFKDGMGWRDVTSGWTLKQVNNSDGSQTVTMYRLLEGTTSSPTVVPGTYEIPIVIEVRGLTQGETFQPSFDAWMVPNTTTNRVAHTTPDALTVSSRPQFNVRFHSGDSYSIQSSGGANKWDFTTADADAKYYDSDVLNSGLGVQTGTLSKLVWDIEMLADDQAKGSKGTEYPREGTSISVDIHLSNTMNALNGSSSTEAAYQPYFWMIYAAEGVQNSTRNSVMQDIWRPYTDNPYFPDPLKNTTGANNRIYNGGTMEVTQNRTDTETVLTVTIHDWDIDASKFPYHMETRSNTNCSTLAMFGSGTSPCNEYRRRIVSGGYIYWMNPSTKNGVSVNDIYNSSVTINQTVTSDAINVVGRSGQTTTTQSDSTDNKVTIAQLVAPSGSFNGLIQFSCTDSGSSYTTWRQGDANGTDCKGTNGDYTNGKDKTYQGGHIRVYSGAQATHSNQGRLATVLHTNLVKFDDTAFDLDDDLILQHPYSGITTLSAWYNSGTDWTNSTNNVIVRYAVKPDGTGWKNDSEQANTTITGLNYYDTLDEAKQHGTPVGLLFINQDSSPLKGYTRISMPSFMLHVRDDATINSTAQITLNAYAWTRETLVNAGVVPSTLNVDSSYEDWKAWCETQDPLELSKTIAFTYGSNPSGYKKATYDENGTYIAGTDGNRLYGDSILIAGERIQISIYRAQRVNNESKYIYDLDKDERYVDWIVSFHVDPLVDGSTDWTTTVTAKIWIGTHEQNIIDSSIYLDGDYTENTPAAGTVTNGRKLTIDSSYMSSTTTANYIINIDNIPVDGATHYIRVTTLIGDPTNPDNDVSSGSSFALNASVTSTRDIIPPSHGNGKSWYSMIAVSKTRGTQLATSASPLIVDANNSIGFKDMIANSAQTDKTNVLAVDQLPANGYYGSSYHGTTTLTGVQLTGVGFNAAGGTATVKATTLDKYSTVDPTTITAEQVNSSDWVTLTINSDGSVTIPSAIDVSKITALAIQISVLPSDTRLDTVITMATSGNQPRDTYVNRLTDMDNIVDATSTVVNRRISGVVFIDGDRDGARADTDKLLASVNVILVASADTANTPITLLDNTTATTTTNSSGAYEFNNVPSGTYRLVFTPANNWTNYQLTIKQAAGVSNDINSDADAQYTLNQLTGATITLDALPTVGNMMSSTYTVLHQDVGLVSTYAASTMPSTGANPYALAILITTILVLAASTVLMGARRKHC